MTVVPTNQGLRPNVREAIRLAVLSALPIWEALPPTDLWRVERPTGQGSSEIMLEPRRGVNAFIQMDRTLQALPEFVAARDLVHEVQPELSGWVGTAFHGRALQFSNVVNNLVIQTQKYCGERPGDALEGLLDELDDLLRTRLVRFAIVEPLEGILVQPFSDELKLGEGVVLRCLRDDEIEDFLSHDATSRGIAPLFGSLLVALEARFETPLLLDVQEMDTVPRRDELSGPLRALDSAVCALHCFKAGSAGVVFQAFRPQQKALPGLDGSYFLPPLPSTAAHYALEHVEFGELERFAQDLSGARLPELRLAASRLRDAELRPLPRDAIVDAFVGIEALLNPAKDSELILPHCDELRDSRAR